MTRDQIYIQELTVETIIGIRPHERDKTQTITISLWMARELHQAGVSEDIDDTLDYGKVCRRLTKMIQASEYYLIEALADAITKILQEEFQIAWFRLKLGKPEAVKNAGEVGLIIEREL